MELERFCVRRGIDLELELQHIWARRSTASQMPDHTRVLTPVTFASRRSRVSSAQSGGQIRLHSHIYLICLEKTSPQESTLLKA